jgi:predicted SprT family Zn-dependent metalloprotease
MHALAGKYWRAKQGWEIVLSRPYHRRYLNEIEGTLKHEMVHVWMHQQGRRQHGVMHGPVFKKEAKRVGAPLYCHGYREMHRPYRYQWECPNCQRRTRSRIRRDWACRACCERYNDGCYTAHFKLKLVQSEEGSG